MKKSSDWITHGSILIGAAYALAFGLRLWKCQFGVDLYDEPFFLVPAFKTFALGDQFFVDDAGDAVRQFDLLNSVFLRPFLSFSVLKIRMVETVFSFALLLWFTRLCFRRVLFLPALLVFIPSFFLGGNFAFSHYMWLRNLLLLHFCILLALQDKGAELQRWGYFVSGLVLGGAVIAYYPAAVSPVLCLLGAGYLICFRPKGFFTHAERSRQLFLYSIGAATIVGCVLLFNLHPKHRQGWISAISILTSLPDYRWSGALEEVGGSVGSVLTRVEIWLVALSGILIFRSLKRSITYFCLLALAGGFVFIHLYPEHTHQYLPSGFFLMYALGVVGALFLLASALRERHLFTFLIAGEVFVLIWVMLITASRFYFVSWILPLVAIPFVAQVFTSRARFQWVLVVVLVSLSLRFTGFQLHTAFYDAPVKECTERLESGPLKGIYTTPRRAFLLKRVEEIVRDKKFILAHGGLPFAFYFGEVRSSTFSTIVYPRNLPRLERVAFERMIERERLPEVVLRAKTKVPSWGTAWVEPETYFETGGFNHFTTCVAQEKIADLPEFEAYRVDPKRVKSCLRSAVVYTLLLDKDFSWIENSS